MEAAVRVIRQLQPAELPLILDMAHKFFEEAAMDGEFNDDNFILAWSGFIKSGNGAIFMMTEDDKVVGAVGGLTYRDIPTGRNTVLEAFWYVDKEFRERGVGSLLVNQLEAWARSMNSSKMIMTALMNTDFSTMEKFYTNKGYRIVEVNFTKEL